MSRLIQEYIFCFARIRNEIFLKNGYHINITVYLEFPKENERLDAKFGTEVGKKVKTKSDIIYAAVHIGCPRERMTVSSRSCDYCRLQLLIFNGSVLYDVAKKICELFTVK